MPEGELLHVFYHQIKICELFLDAEIDRGSVGCFSAEEVDLSEYFHCLLIEGSHRKPQEQSWWQQLSDAVLQLGGIALQRQCFSNVVQVLYFLAQVNLELVQF